MGTPSLTWDAVYAGRNRPAVFGPEAPGSPAEPATSCMSEGRVDLNRGPRTLRTEQCAKSQCTPVMRPGAPSGVLGGLTRNVQPSKNRTVHTGRDETSLTESLILAQDERWRRASYMQVERGPSSGNTREDLVANG